MADPPPTPPLVPPMELDEDRLLAGAASSNERYLASIECTVDSRWSGLFSTTVHGVSSFVLLSVVVVLLRFA